MEQTAADDLMSDAVYHQPVNFEMIGIDMMGNIVGNVIGGGMNKLYQDHQLNKDWNPYLKKQVQAGMNPVGTYLNNVDTMANNVAARTWWQNTSSANDQSWQRYAINTLNKAHEAFSRKAPVDHFRQAQNQMAVNAARLNAARSAAMTHAILVRCELLKCL